MRGKERRLDRLFHRKRALIVAMDHGIPLGFAEGLEDPLKTLETLKNFADAVIVNVGVLRSMPRSLADDLGLVLKLNGVTTHSTNPFDLQVVSTVEEAVFYGVDAVSYEMYINGPEEPGAIRSAGEVVRAARKWDMPVIMHVYPHGESVEPSLVSHCLRLGWELGADVVKTFQYQGMKKDVESVGVPVLISGGPKMKATSEVIEYVRRAVREGARGVAVGRNLWGFEKPDELAAGIRKILDSE